MGATIQKRGKSYRIAVHQDGKREYKTVRDLATAKDLVKLIAKQELAGVNLIESIQKAREALPAVVTCPLLKPTVLEWLDGQVAGGDLRYATVMAYKQRLATYVFPTLGDRPVNRVSREDIGQIITQIKHFGKSRACIDQIRNPLVRCFNDLIVRKIIPGPNPCSDLRHYIGKAKPKVSDAPEYFTIPEATRLLTAARALYPQYATFIQTGLQAGLRFGEISALRQSDIDWKKSKIHVQRTQSVGGRIEPPKTAKGNRLVKIPPSLLATLKSQCEAATLEGQVKGWGPDARALVFPNSRGTMHRYSNFLLVWNKIIEQTGLQYRTAHKTRHTFGTIRAEHGTDLRYLRDQMGHSSVKMTADLYSHVAPEHHEESVKVLDAMVTTR